MHLEDHKKPVHYSQVFYNETESRHSVAKIHAGNPPAHPDNLKKIVGDRLAKCIFVNKNALCRHLRVTQSVFESCFGSKWGKLWTILAVYVAKKP